MEPSWNGSIADFSITGLTSNPSIFDKAIRDTTFYDDAIRGRPVRRRSSSSSWRSGICRSRRESFRPVYEGTNGTDGWASLLGISSAGLESRPGLEAAWEPKTLRGVESVHQDPGNLAGLTAIENATFDGIPVNVTLLFSGERSTGGAGLYAGDSGEGSMPVSTWRFTP